MEGFLTTVDADGAITIPPDLLRDCDIVEGDEVTLERFEHGIRICRRDRPDVGSHD